jgi:cytochrome P450
MEFSKDPINTLQALKKKYGPVFTLNLFISKFTYLIDPKLVNTLYTWGPDLVDRQKGVIGAVHAVLGLPKSMLLKYGDTTVQWMKEGYLNDKQLEYFDQWIGEMVPGFIADWASMKKFDLFDACAHAVLNVMFRIALGKKFMAQHGPQAVEYYSNLQTYAIMPLNIFAPWLPFGAPKKASESRTKLYNMVEEFIKQNNEYEPGTYVKILANLNAFDKAPYEYIIAHIVSIALAGHSNTNGALGWTISHLAKNPKAMQRVREDVKKDKSLKQPFLRDCIKESIRMYTNLNVPSRTTLKPMEFGGYKIPVGTTFMGSNMALTNDPSIVPNPREWDPFRQPDLKGIQYPFGSGLWTCVGKKFVMLFVVKFMVTLYSKYDVTIESDIPQPNWEANPGTPTPVEPVLAKLNPIRA